MCRVKGFQNEYPRHCVSVKIKINFIMNAKIYIEITIVTSMCHNDQLS